MCFKFFNKIAAHKKDDDIECIELMMEYSIAQNNKECNINMNSHNELMTFSPYFTDYIRRILGSDEEIVIKKSEQEIKIASYETEKIIQYIMSGDIVIRDKKFVEVFPILKSIYKFEEGRKHFVESIKKMKIDEYIKKIDDKYVELYKMNKNTNIDLYSGVHALPYFNVYNYLMTFEKKSTTLSIEDNVLSIYYVKNNITYKIILESESGNSSFGVMMMKVKNINGEVLFLEGILPERPQKGCFWKSWEAMNFETSYVEKVFEYHKKNLYEVLNQKYKNYQFSIGYKSFNSASLENNYYSNYRLTLFIH